MLIRCLEQLARDAAHQSVKLLLDRCERVCILQRFQRRPTLSLFVKISVKMLMYWKY